MSGFQLDTSGVVPLPHDEFNGYLWSDLTPFAQGYVKAMPWESLRVWRWVCADCDHEGAEEDANAEFDWCGHCLVAVASSAKVCPKCGRDDLSSACPKCGGSWFESPRDLGFCALSSSALAAILADCVDGGDGARGGRLFWAMRQRGEFSIYPPLRVFLNDEGKVALEPQP
jgi:hypothetical protein